eukprot:GILI01006906.1.p1 GENE.GILI01006906.1~~GILI01006906.1.p1  ORF type:complete len:291 (-),score=20.65 GILI01006906.1:174-1046(-)
MDPPMAHLNVKPSNVLLDSHQLSIAKLSDPALSPICQPHLPYSAPERFKDPGSGPEALKADVWSFGCVMMHLLTLSRFWEGLSEVQMMYRIAVLRQSPVEAAMAEIPPYIPHLDFPFHEAHSLEYLFPSSSGGPPPLRSGPYIPLTLRGLARDCCQLDPEKRPSMRQVRSRLEEITRVIVLETAAREEAERQRKLEQEMSEETEELEKHRKEPKEKVLESESNDALCVVCFEQPKEFLFAPCGHLCLCTECVAPYSAAAGNGKKKRKKTGSFDSCPICCQDFNAVIRVFK